MAKIKAFIGKIYFLFRSRIKKLLNRYGHYSTLQKEIIEVVQKYTNMHDVIIFTPTLDWNMPLFQRPQQMALAYSKLKGKDIKVIYLTPNAQYEYVDKYQKINSNLIVLNYNYVDVLNVAMKQVKSVTAVASWADNYKHVKQLKFDYLIYEYIDNISIFEKYNKKMEANHNELLSMANVTVCTATELYNQVKDRTKNPIISTNGADYNFFSKTNSYFTINKKIQKRIKKYSCVLGYYGALAEWFDYDIVKEVAMSRPNWCWLLIGLNYDNSLDFSGILELPNVIYVPPQPYFQLPTYLKAFDIATIPFIIDDITIATSPVKLFEYMAAQKPVITSKLPECIKYNSVHTYDDAEMFLEQAENLLKMKNDSEYLELLKQEAQANTWESKACEILNSFPLAKNI